MLFRSWSPGGHTIHTGPNPPDPFLRKVQSRQDNLDARMDSMDSTLAAATTVQQQMLHTLEQMSLSLKRLNVGHSSARIPSEAPIARRLEHLEATNNALFVVVNGLRESSGSRTASAPPVIQGPSISSGGEILVGEQDPSPPPLLIRLPARPSYAPERRIVAEVQTSPSLGTAPLLYPRTTVAVQTSPSYLPLHLAQEVQTSFEEPARSTEGIGIQVPSNPSSPPRTRLDMEIQTQISLPGQSEFPIFSSVSSPFPVGAGHVTPYSTNAGTSLETLGSRSTGFANLSPLTSLSALDVLPTFSSQPIPASDVQFESPQNESPAPALPALRRSARAGRGGKQL